MLSPKEVPIKKNHVKILTKQENKTDRFVTGDIALISLETKYIKPFELEAIRKLAVRYIRNNKFIIGNKKAVLFFRIFPFVSLTAKAKAVRMGKGKGSHVLWVYPIVKGKIILELKGLGDILSFELLDKIQSKLSVKSKIIRNNIDLS